MKLRSAAAIAAILLVVASSAQLALAQTEFLPLLFSGKPKISEEQAAQVAGVWEQVDGFRLDGSVLDDILRKAAKAAVADNSTDVDFTEVLANASSPATGPLTFKVYIPGVDTDTGAFAAYYLIGKEGEKPAVSRVLGMGASTPEGVMLVGTKDEDTGMWYGLVKDEETMVALYLEGVEAWNGDRTKITDNQVVAQYTYKKMPAEEIKDALALVVAKDALAENESAQIAATDRKEHSGKSSN
ncbi:alpha subunit [Chlorella sorokiniana]|uniref:Alpha subunit n=1 Tax=Chlorella sorokiniana TaxID=3076 RepID=A0A2P6TVF6_CHLSO|nr:alpha subunit [Chlorella sorokiniana]|eukprot:PRW58050.1 alpha subunit [Chlorella sorokiniana]